MRWRRRRVRLSRPIIGQVGASLGTSHQFSLHQGPQIFRHTTAMVLLVRYRPHKSLHCAPDEIRSHTYLSLPLLSLSLAIISNVPHSLIDKLPRLITILLLLSRCHCRTETGLMPLVSDISLWLCPITHWQCPLSL